jgi:transposase
MKFVAIKTVDQQAILALHRARELFVKQRTAQANQIRGSLQEFGVVIPKGISNIQKLPEILEENQDKLSVAVVALFSDLYTHFKLLDKKVEGFDSQIEKQAKQDPVCSAVMELPGVGPLIASAAVATIGDAKLFKNGREVSAFLGLVPKQRSSGETTRLLGITKRGDRYLRKILIQGARNIVTRCDTKTDGLSVWVADKKQRRGYNKAAVALANKNARIIWALMATGEAYRGPVTLAA